MNEELQSIEKAFVEAQQSAHSSLLDDGHHTFDCAGCNTTRAYGLAVLEAAFAVPERVDSIYVARKDVDALRARIEAPGLPE